MTKEIGTDKRVSISFGLPNLVRILAGSYKDTDYSFILRSSFFSHMNQSKFSLRLLIVGDGSGIGLGFKRKIYYCISKTTIHS